MVAVPGWVWGKWHSVCVERGEGAACSPHPRNHRSVGMLELWDAEVPVWHKGSGCDQTGLVLFYGGPASLPCDHGTQPGEMSQALLSFLLLLLRAGLKWLLSSRSLRKNKIWFAIPCSTWAGSSALRARETAFCHGVFVAKRQANPEGLGFLGIIIVT